MSQKMKKGVKVLGLIVALMIFMGVVVAITSADSSSGSNNISSNTIYVPEDYEKIQWAHDISNKSQSIENLSSPKSNSKTEESSQNKNFSLVGHYGGKTWECAVFDDYALIGQGQSLVILDVSHPDAPSEVGRVQTDSLIDGITISGNYAYVIGGYLAIINISNPTSPRIVSNSEISGGSVAVVGDYAYVTASGDFLICNISNKESPVLLSSRITPGFASDVAVDDDYAYVADGQNGLVIIDISNPTSPRIAGSSNIEVYANDVAVYGNYAYVADEWNGLAIVNIGNPASPKFTTRCDIPGWSQNVAVVKNYAYVTDRDYGLVIINISNPIAPIWQSNCNITGYARDIEIAGNFAYVADMCNGLVIVNVSNSTYPTLTGRYNTYGTIRDLLHSVSAEDVTVASNYAYVSYNEIGLLIINVSDPSSPSLAGSYDTEGYARSVAISGNYAYVADGWQDGLVIINISNPTAPILTSTYDSGHAESVVTSGDYAYVADRDYGLVIINISNPASPQLAGSYYTGHAFDVAIEGNFAYVADWGQGLVIVNISTLTSPTLTAKFDLEQWTDDVSVFEDYAYVCGEYDGFLLVNISTPTSPTLASRYSKGHPSSITIAGSYGYMANGAEGLLEINISDPTSPKDAGSYDTAGGVCGVTVVENYVYLADYGNGLVILRKVVASIFNTGSPSNPYPSISGTHNGTISPSSNINVSKLYTYACPGTGGHTQFVRIWNNSGLDMNATWNGYKGDWHNISFDKNFTLVAGETYNYTIRTGSYPQIIHESPFNATGGVITCTSFEDINGKRHGNWIPAIRLE